MNDQNIIMGTFLVLVWGLATINREVTKLIMRHSYKPEPLILIRRSKRLKLFYVFRYIIN